MNAPDAELPGGRLQPLEALIFKGATTWGTSLSHLRHHCLKAPAHSDQPSARRSSRVTVARLHTAVM
jgi:hypothetical protein